MSDFLTHLASRSSNRLPQVQPRLASRFENRVATSGIGLERTGLGEGEREVSLSGRGTSVFDLSYTPSPPQSSLQPNEMTQRGTNPVRSLAVDALEKDSSQGRSPAIIENSRIESSAIAARNREIRNHEIHNRENDGLESSGFNSSELENSVIQPQLPETTHLIAPSIVRPQSSLPFSALSNSSFPSVQPLPSSGDLTEQVSSQNPDTLTARPDKVSQTLQPAESSIVSASNRVQPQMTSRLESFPATPLPSPPTIQVTIGRIEVRAQTSPGQSKPSPRRPTPALTLDQYLSQRSGGQA